MDYSLVLLPLEAAQILVGWPEHACLVVTEENGFRKWDAVPEDLISGAVGRLPVWPPMDGFETANLPSEVEMAVIEHLRAEPDIVRVARQRLEASSYLPEACTSLEEINWDE